MHLKEPTEQVQDILWTLQIVQNQNRIVNGPNRHKGPGQHSLWTIYMLLNQSSYVHGTQSYLLQDQSNTDFGQWRY